MKIGLLFFADTYLAEDQDKSLMGRFVANDQFLQALNDAGHTVFLYVSTQMETEYLEKKFDKRFENVQIVTFAQLYLEPTRFEPDVLHMQSPNLYKCFHLRHQVFNKAIPVTGVTHSLGHQPFLEWVMLNHLHGALACDALVCTSPTARAVVENFHERVIPYLPEAQKLKTKVIPLGIFPHTSPKEDRSHWRKHFKMDANDFCLSWVGRFSYATKADLGPVLMALRQLGSLKLKRNIRFYFAGSSNQASDIEILKLMIDDLDLKNKVTLIPNITADEKIGLLSASDVFLAPSDNVQETFGISLIEALNAGLPVIASDWDGFKSIVDESCGVLVPTWHLPSPPPAHEMSALQLDSINHFWMSQSVIISPDDICQAIQKLAEDEDYLKRLSQGAKLRSLSFQWAQIIGKYEELWQELIQRATSVTLAPKGPTLNYQEDFLPYWTNSLPLTQQIVTSVAGNDLLKGVIPARFYPEMEEWIIASLLKDIMMNTLNPISCENLLAAFKEDSGVLNLHLSWLMKYGFIKRAN